MSKRQVQEKGAKKAPVARGRRSQAPTLFSWPFGWKNLVVFAAGLIIIVLGYIFLAQGPADNPLSLTVAPILLVFGYLIVIPASILVKSKKRGDSAKS